MGNCYAQTFGWCWMSRDLDGSVPWAWVAACLTCSEPHEYRPERCQCGQKSGGGLMTWKADDGHSYRARLSPILLNTLRTEYLKVQNVDA